METLSLGAQLASLLLQIEICNLSQEIFYGSRRRVARTGPASASTTPLRFSISTYYRLTALCQRSGVKLLKKIAEREKNVSRNWLVACSVGCLAGFLPARSPAHPPAVCNRIPNECFSTLP